MFPAHVEPFVEKNFRTVMFSVHTKQAIACTIDGARGLNEKSCKIDLLKKERKKREKRANVNVIYTYRIIGGDFKKRVKINISFRGKIEMLMVIFVENSLNSRN